MDPVTGLFASGNGLDRKLDQGLEPIRGPRPSDGSRNGPEWGVDRQGAAVFYTKRDDAGVMQLWRARALRFRIEVEQLTFGTANSRGIRPSVFPDADRVWLFFSFGSGASFAPVVAAADAADDHLPVDDYYVPSGGGRFLQAPESGRIKLLHTRSVAGNPEAGTQIAWLDVETGAVDILTGDAGEKIEPRWFRAPEYGGEMLILALIDNERVAIYRDTGAADGLWTRVEELTLPAGEVRRFLSSIKPVQSISGVDGIGGVSYFTLGAAIARNDSSDNAMWVLGLGTGAERLCRRVDSGAASGLAANRFEPEPLLGEAELFLVYNSQGGGDAKLNRARTGILVPAR